MPVVKVTLEFADLAEAERLLHLLKTGEHPHRVAQVETGAAPTAQVIPMTPSQQAPAQSMSQTFAPQAVSSVQPASPVDMPATASAAPQPQAVTPKQVQDAMVAYVGKREGRTPLTAREILVEHGVDSISAASSEMLPRLLYAFQTR